MKELNDFSNQPEISKKDPDKIEFREQTLATTQSEMQVIVIGLNEALTQKDYARVESIIIESSDRLARTMLQADTHENISSTDNTAIMHSLGMVLWKKPMDIEILEKENIHQLVQTAVRSNNIDYGRIANGIYFLYVLLHKYKNANGRTARALQLSLSKANEDSKVEENDVKKVLGINRETLTQMGKTRFKINFNPDFERLVLGIAYFGIHKGLTEEQVVDELKLNSKLPEDGLKDLSRKLQITEEKLKEEFIKFIVSESDLSWCDFNKA
jgi:hypothetical protein